MPPRKKQKAGPAPEAKADDPEDDNIRWPFRARLIMVASLLRGLTLEQIDALADGGDYPRSIPWPTIYDGIRNWIKKQGGRHGKKLTGKLPAERTMRERSKTYVKRLLKFGHISDLPPHEVGYKWKRNRPVLLKVFNMLAAGYPDQKGQTCLYRNLPHLETLKPEAKALRTAEFPEGCGLQTTKSMWKQLRQAHPQLVTVVARQKKERARAPVQVCAHGLAATVPGGCWPKAPWRSRRLHVPACAPGLYVAAALHSRVCVCVRMRQNGLAYMQKAAKMLLGQIPVEYPDFYFKSDAPRLTRLAAQRAREQQPFYWHADFHKNQWFFDAFTVDPTDIVASRKGIWVRGVPQPIMEGIMVNVTVGAAPKVLVYIGVHHDFGTHAWFAYHGAKHGGSAEKKADAAMYEGFKFWHQELSGEAQDFIKQRHYYNTPHSVEGFQKRASASEKQEFESGPFHPKFFMVRPCATCMRAPRAPRPTLRPQRRSKQSPCAAVCPRAARRDLSFDPRASHGRCCDWCHQSPRQGPPCPARDTQHLCARLLQQRTARRARSVCHCGHASHIVAHDVGPTVSATDARRLDARALPCRLRTPRTLALP